MYVVKCNDNTYYTGVTIDLDRRVSEHNGSLKGAKYTKTRRPVKLVYNTEFKNRSLACIAEAKFKKLSRIKKIKIIKS
jgi:putative endonuclease